MTTDPQSGTNVQEIAAGIFRINTPVPLPDGSPFSFNQYLVVDDQPLLFHSGPRQLFAMVSQAIASVMPLERLRYVGLSHVEADECGALNLFLAAAPEAVPLCGSLAGMLSIGDMADRAPRTLADREELVLGGHTMRWFDTPHLPHGWECGLMMDTQTRTFLCGDLFTQPGSGKKAVVDTDILGPSEAFRHQMDYYAHAPQTAAMLAGLAQQEPRTLACMHGSAWQGDGASLLRQLSDAVSAAP
ncbi:Metallo-beta-lactamase superfamily protein [Variovorax sp. PBL-H6]|uniref:MBL fold metallo-hydrolase n=1 Tax=Variovorax sp. PBL-H6 TaxID=434009 RepID=UPI001317108D|nr:MBL fold metallo-hydrolase [Variovorax sp. PBL-H6]VTU24393.1 Metallo-beta-lactamase superfamily protein [Variovorax sp. PBL-H6]